MPLLRIFTNVPKNKIPKDFVDKVMPVMVAALGKPVEKMICVISGDTPVSFAGQSQEPAAVADLVSIGSLGPDENQRITRALSQFIQKEIGVPSNRSQEYGF
ncbi:MIF-like protein mif-2 [Eumeta japonica]|uniref:L-dopachrome isomerase n=1 Tax=Eumeta variegata TaxID=151549 RepID=A0A4C1XS50_EUMVA|nr:MIF-like protein mif-2 [Eumeta japonica]